MTLPALELDLGIGIVPALLKYLARIGPFPNDFQQVIVRVKKVHALLALMIDGAMRSIHGDGHRPSVSIASARTTLAAGRRRRTDHSSANPAMTAPRALALPMAGAYGVLAALCAAASLQRR